MCCLSQPALTLSRLTPSRLTPHTRIDGIGELILVVRCPVHFVSDGGRDESSAGPVVLLVA